MKISWNISQGVLQWCRIFLALQRHHTNDFVNPTFPWWGVQRQYQRGDSTFALEPTSDAPISAFGLGGFAALKPRLAQAIYRLLTFFCFLLPITTCVVCLSWLSLSLRRCGAAWNPTGASWNLTGGSWHTARLHQFDCTANFSTQSISITICHLFGACRRSGCVSPLAAVLPRLWF